MFGGDLRGDPTEKLCFSGSVLGDEALPFPAEGQPCFSAVLTPPFTGAFLIVLCPPPWQPPAAPVPAHSQGRTQVKGLAALPCHPHPFHSPEWPHFLGLGAAQGSFENQSTCGP